MGPDLTRLPLRGYASPVFPHSRYLSGGFATKVGGQGGPYCGDVVLWAMLTQSPQRSYLVNLWLAGKYYPKYLDLLF